MKNLIWNFVQWNTPDESNVEWNNKANGYLFDVYGEKLVAKNYQGNIEVYNYDNNKFKNTPISSLVEKILRLEANLREIITVVEDESYTLY